MTDRKIIDEWPGNEPRDGKDGWRRGNARGLHLQQIVDPVEEEAYSGVGTKLRAERERQQYSVADISGALRIQQAHLLALEEGRTDDLPGPTYAIGFLRTYSEFFGLDGDEIIRQFKREATLVPVERRIAVPEPLDEARRPGLRLALVSLVVAGAVYGGWIFLERQGLLPIEVVAEPPERLAPYQAATDAAEAAPKADTADAAATPPAAEAVAENAADDAVDNNVAAAAPGDGPVANMADTAVGTGVGTGAGEAQAEASDTVAADGDAAAPAATGVTAEVTTETTAEAATETTAEAATETTAEAAAETTAETASVTTPTQPTQSAAPPVGAGTTGQAAVTMAPVTPASDESGPAVAANPNGLANTDQTPAAPAGADSGVSIGDMPASANLAAADASAPPLLPSATDSTAKPAVEDRVALAVTMEEAAQAQPAAPQPTPSLPEGGAAVTAPVQPSVQPSVRAAINPPPPPAAPSANPLTQGVGEGRSGGASQATAREGLRYRPQAYGVSNRDARVVLRARAESWVQVQGANNELLLTRMLRAGDSYHAPNRDDLVLMTGNAGAIEIIVDGEALGALGTVGQVRRDIRLNADLLREQLQPTTESSP
jgi:cytoskeletal protein RodZ